MRGAARRPGGAVAAGGSHGRIGLGATVPGGVVGGEVCSGATVGAPGAVGAMIAGVASAGDGLAV